VRSGRIVLWVLLLLASAGVHLLLGWRAGESLGIAPGTEGPQSATVTRLRLAPAVSVPEEEREQLHFEPPLVLETPTVLLAADAAAPPPPGVELALRAAAGAGESLPLPPVPGGSGVFSTTGMGQAGFGSGIGNGLSESANRFAAYVQGLRSGGLDVVFVIDATGSMDWVIEEVRRRVIDIADATRSLVPLTRFGVVAYRDHDDPEFTVREQPLTFSLARLGRFLGAVEAKGGGSWQEAVHAGVEAAVRRAGWRPGAKHVVLLIGDAPPHENDLEATLALARELARGGGELSTLDVSNDSNPALIEASLGRKVNRALYRERPMLQFESLAEAGGGEAATLQGDVHVSRQLVTLIMGGEFAHEMALLLEGL
jgi:hypothetical protein